MRRLPIALLTPFEAVGRTGSFRAASMELDLTPSAVSHSIRKLEDFVGVQLFIRGGPKIRMTAEGEALFQRALLAMDAIREGFDLISTQQPKLLRLHCAPSFAAQCLAPRLLNFFELHSDLDIRLSSNLRYAIFPSVEFDADVTYGNYANANCISMPLGNETVTPMCSPKLALGLRRPHDVINKRIIHSDNKRVRWVDWFQANDLAMPELLGLRFDRSFLALRAAVDGLGVCLESTRLAERELASEQLVCPFWNCSKPIHYVGHYFVYSRSTRNLASVKLFERWLLNQLDLEPMHK